MELRPKLAGGSLGGEAGTVTDDRWRMAYTIYETAASLSEPERPRYVRTAAPDEEIAAKVLAMLAGTETFGDSTAYTQPIAAATQPGAGEPAGHLPNGASVGRFIVTGFVGQGGMGRVYAAHDPDLNREVALKVIGQKADVANSERFIREAQAASALNHPNIVTVYEVIHAGPLVAIAMELVHGTSLRRFCETGQPVRDVALWGRQIANALAAAHKRGIVHRDIKPENLMLRPDGYIKVLDFGLARQIGAERVDDLLPAGTLGYMSPEELLQRPVTTASDIFSLGIVLYELASGTNPFRADTPGATIRLIQRLDAPALPVQSAAVPRELDGLLRAMLSTSAADRPTASEVAVRLDGIVQPRLFRRRTVWAAASLAVCALGGFAVWRVPHPARTAPVLLQSLPLDSEPASETGPAFSPDGGSIVYGSDLGSPGIHHLVIRSVATLASGGIGSPRTVTSAPQDDSNPVWSPDGSRIAFLRTRSSEVLEVIVIPAGGGPEHVIATLHGYRPSARKYLTWTPDGQALVAADRSNAEFALRLYRLPLAGGARQRITEGPDSAQDVSPAFSPDGHSLAYLRWENGATYELCLVPGQGGSLRLLVTSPLPITAFAWKPDNRTIVYSLGPMSTGELQQVSIDGRREVASFALEGASDQITIAPRGGRLAYVLQNLDANIWRVPLDRTGRNHASAPEKLFASVREEMDPAVSPDGNSVAFISNRSGHWKLWTGNMDGAGLRELAGESFLPSHPAWSPDSREIAFEARAFGNGEVWLVSAAGGQPWKLADLPGGAEVPSWSRDGKRVFFYTNAAGSRQIWEVPATGGPAVRLTHGGTYDPSESADGRYLYYGSVVSPGIWRMPLEPRAADGSLASQDGELIKETLPVSGHRFWTVGEGGIYFVDARKTPALLKVIDPASHKITQLATLPKPPAKFTRGLSISPDGRYALYCVDDMDRYEIRVVADFR